MRVEIPAYTDSWMKGDRYGLVTRVSKKIIERNEPGLRGMHETEIAHVKLEISRKTTRVILDHCTIR